ncbi:Bestrophin, RFP-TM, chloride channel-domain-containing protein [Polychytrium aggregatum]|uniref:Bestrophin, RFP-TM, chloride channel-domain-containing protein n=1 Tax=Polychytrium aggregatum TaxID=110093 RepID=UPI0022FEAD63|nr:Bestrophin, RFP-TM, chloride channel-domain-containing protein [Polychytrium aggregatum]KAI9206331.1 Bestrophin, RFP-TM, chloride channel-domain-containing protein [Polychytrium aggregatum]
MSQSQSSQQASSSSSAPATEASPLLSVPSGGKHHKRHVSYSDYAKSFLTTHHATQIRVDISSNVVRYRYIDAVAYKGSVIPKILIPATIVTVWSLLWTVLYEVYEITWFAIPPQLISILGVVMGLLLVFRNNTSYDRYWEGCRTWSSIRTQIRNMARIIWIGVAAKDGQQEAVFRLKKGAMNLLMAFASSTKHFLRNELDYKYSDLAPLIVHLPDYHPSNPNPPELVNLPIEISFHLSSFISYCKEHDLIDGAQQGALNSGLASIVDSLAVFERIRNTPIPVAYSIHLKQTLVLYILSLPFQIVAPLGWATIPVTFMAAFTLLGMESIGGEIENPFGYDENDLPLDEYCTTVREELNRIMTRPTEYSPDSWKVPYEDEIVRQSTMSLSKATIERAKAIIERKESIRGEKLAARVKFGQDSSSSSSSSTAV